ncbi:hypothetical protein [Neorhizobium galegae]|uniref:hypothetical protein n=1 Tax=Neorhizobium galegae TaxID=399 RepID=UPI0006214FBA|nr:hypothetical protein [Neorhizobium galegae]KAB1126924.1 hypothetical protein F4V90_07530 [Neorhizobium galegae]MCQ1808609.1 hypothetical protein [Neorhizobium galegae]CDZ57176.1 Hypothetical protein NGAL_HAMBI2566_17290 [Neorhizobium galegae bv. orientalis]
MRTDEPDANPKPHVIFYDDIADTKYRDRLKLHNEELYKYYRAQEGLSHTGHMEYAKWLFASLLAVHGGAIYALNSLKSSIPVSKSDFLIYAAAQNLAAVFLTLVAGMFAWINLQLAEMYYREVADPALLYRHEHSTEDVRWIDRTMYLSAGFGIASGLLFASSSITVIVGLVAAKPAPLPW